MGQHVCMGAMLKCSFGVAPATLMVIPKAMEMSGGPVGGNIMDNIPMANVLPFGMCQSMANPMVAAATAAALGVLTPMPCIPATVAPWVPGVPTALVGNMPTLNNTSKLMCMWGGMIEVTVPGEFTVQVP